MYFLEWKLLTFESSFFEISQTSYWPYVSVGSGYDWMPSANKPLHAPVLNINSLVPRRWNLINLKLVLFIPWGQDFFLSFRLGFFGAIGSVLGKKGRDMISEVGSICWAYHYTNTFSISPTKSQNFLNVSYLVLQLSLLNPLKPGVKSRMEM